MEPDLAKWLGLAPRTARRLEFLRPSNERASAAVPCRLPECSEYAKRRGGQGRSAWFHDPKCAHIARRRRRAIDDALAELASAYFREGATERVRTPLAWNAKWLMGVRLMYETPDGDSENATSLSIGQRDAVARLAEAVDGRVARKVKHACPTCGGTGDVAALMESGFWSEHTYQIGASATIMEIVNLLHRLVFLVPEDPTLARWLDEARRWASQHGRDLYG